jgi:hypothetical protein
VKHEKTTFKNSDVVLDGNEYVGCTFESCTFIYSATGPFTLNGNQISANCRFAFRGAASDTVNAMKGIYSMGEWGRRHVLATFQSIAPDLKNLH